MSQNGAMELARKIAQNGPVGEAAAKWAIDMGTTEATSMEEALEIERQAYPKVLRTEDRLEGSRRSGQLSFAM